jgi:hypothetical protein
MRLCSADLSPQAQRRARCPRSLVKNRRREAASPYHVRSWSKMLHGRTGTGCPSYDEEVSRKMQGTASGKLALPF